MARKKPVKRYKQGSSVGRDTADKAISEKNAASGFGGAGGNNDFSSKLGSQISGEAAAAAMAAKGGGGGGGGMSVAAPAGRAGSRGGQAQRAAQEQQAAQAVAQMMGARGGVQGISGIAGIPQGVAPMQGGLARDALLGGPKGFAQAPAIGMTPTPIDFVPSMDLTGAGMLPERGMTPVPVDFVPSMDLTGANMLPPAPGFIAGPKYTGEYVQQGALTPVAAEMLGAIPGEAVTPADLDTLGLLGPVQGPNLPAGYATSPTRATSSLGMAPQSLAADTATTAQGVPPAVSIPGAGPMAAGMSNFFGGMRDVFSGQQPLFGEGGFLPADTSTMADYLASEAASSRGSNQDTFGGQMFPEPEMLDDAALSPEPAPVAPVFTPPAYAPPPLPTPNLGYQSYNDLMAALQGLPMGMAGGGMVQTNPFPTGSYYAAYDPRRRGLGGM